MLISEVVCKIAFAGAAWMASLTHALHIHEGAAARCDLMGWWLGTWDVVHSIPVAGDQF